ncbi:hypothetical protein EB118_04295 [bacterium]|nr:hypothetical protein [bacterium]
MASILYVDPASISSGWALFVNGQLQDSGTVLADKKANVFKRLYQIYSGYKKLGIKADEVHIEQLVRNTHIFTHWSVSVIALGVFHSGVQVDADIPISSWQKFTEWKEERTPLQIYKRRVGSEDELAAIGMGLWHTARTSEGGVAKKKKRKQ